MTASDAPPPEVAGSGSPGTGLPGIIARSPAMQEVCRVAGRVADAQSPVLILGEPGVGKSAIAAALHRLGPGSQRPLVRIDSGDLSADELAEPWFRSLAGSGDAEAGTIYFREIERMPSLVQGRLIGAVAEADAGGRFRVVASSSRDLAGEVEAGRLRSDLYWWLNVVPIEIPPLRDRREDIPELVAEFLRRSNERNGRRVQRVHPEAMAVLQAYPWPGNILELRSYVERAVVMAEGDALTIDLLPSAVSGVAPIRTGGLDRFDLGSLTEEVVAQGIAAVPEDDPNPGLHSKIVNSVERELMLQVLRGCHGVRTQAAARLGINRNTLHKKMKEYGLDTESPEG